MLTHNVTQVGAGASVFALKLGGFGQKAAEKIEQTAKSAAEKLRKLAERTNFPMPFPDEQPPALPPLALPPPDAPSSQGPLLLLAAVVVLLLVLR